MIDCKNTYLKEVNNYEERLKQAYEIIEKSAITVFEWSIGPGIPVKFVTENISIYGYSAKDFYSGKVDYWDFVHKDDAEYTRKAIYEKRESDATEFKHTYRVACKDGSIRWVEEWTSWERDESGKPITEKGIIRDITKQVETEEKLRRSEERYRNLFENACALICTFNQKGKFISVNRACTEISGYSRQQLLDMSIFDLLRPYSKDEKSNPKDLSNFINKIENNNIEVTINTQNNKKLILEGRLLILYEAEDNVEIQAVMQDVTSRKEAENKIYYLSYHDKLSGLYNRAYYDEFLNKLDNAAEFPYSIILGDINNLKETNDLYGHKSGDTLIQNIACILQKSCRDSDIVARVGGDEFAIILPKSTDKIAQKVCDRIKKMCNSCEDSSPKPDIALGYSTKNDSLKTNNALICEADYNMYKDKFQNSKKYSNRSLNHKQL